MEFVESAHAYLDVVVDVVCSYVREMTNWNQPILPPITGCAVAVFTGAQLTRPATSGAVMQVRRRTSGGVTQVRRRTSGAVTQVRRRTSGAVTQVRKRTSGAVTQVRKRRRL